MDILAGLRSVATVILGVSAVAVITVIVLAVFGQWGMRGVEIGVLALLVVGAFVTGAFNK